MNRIQTLMSSITLPRGASSHPAGHWFRRSLIPAIRGLNAVTREESNFRIELVIAFAALSLSAILRISATQWVLVILSIGLVLISEILNTAIERIGDIINPAFDPLIGRIKDIAAAAVLLAAVIALLTGAFVFIPIILELQ